MYTQNNLEPSSFLVENIDLLPGGRVLDIAMGCGRNALYLAKNGFDVEGIDIDTASIETALERARTAGTCIKTRIADLESGSYSIEKNAYDAIICFNYLHRPHIPQIKSGLKESGFVVYETFTVDQARFGRPANPDFLLGYNELRNMFNDFRCLRYYEGIFENKRATAGIVAQKIK
jgi:SAM-dependent methyltransferase